MSGFEVRVNDRELTELNRVLRRTANRQEMQRRLKRELRVEARKIIPPLKQSIASIPSHGMPHLKGRKPLRVLLAKAPDVQIKVGYEARVRVFMNPNKLPEKMRSLADYMEGTPGHEHWRHPVFGKWRRGMGDQSNHPYFERGTRDAERDAIEGVRRVMEQIAGEIESR